MRFHGRESYGLAAEKRLLTEEQTRHLLADVPDYVRLIVELARWTGARISEVLGLQWKHVDLDGGWILIRQRWYRGDLDETKSERGKRDLPVGYLVKDLKAAYPGPGNRDRFVFDRGDGEPYDDRALLKDFLRPAAKELGIYFQGFGFHSLRRSNITRLQAVGASAIEAQIHAGHAKPDMTAEYTRIERQRHKQLVIALQRMEMEHEGTVQ